MLDGLKILFVDDDADVLHLVERFLVNAHAEVIIATSGAKALALVDSARPDVIVSDISMPDFDGYQFIESVRGKDIHTPAIALTAQQDNGRLRPSHLQTDACEDADRCDRGANALMTKSYDEISRKTIPNPDSSWRPSPEQVKQAHEGFRAMDDDETALHARVAAALPGVQVEVSGDRVTLRGQVDQATLAKAADTARGIDGVGSVDDQLVAH